MVTLSEAQMPNHNHTLRAANVPFGPVQAPAGDRALNRASANVYQTNTANNMVDMNADALPIDVGGSLPHNNLQPFLTMSFIIALVGLYPSRS